MKNNISKPQTPSLTDILYKTKKPTDMKNKNPNNGNLYSNLISDPLAFIAFANQIQGDLGDRNYFNALMTVNQYQEMLMSQLLNNANQTYSLNAMNFKYAIDNLSPEKTSKANSAKSTVHSANYSSPSNTYNLTSTTYNQTTTAPNYTINNTYSTQNQSVPAQSYKSTSTAKSSGATPAKSSSSSSSSK